MAAIFAALVQQKIVYNDPPASYEVIGQRIRLPHKVLEQKWALVLTLRCFMPPALKRWDFTLCCFHDRSRILRLLA